MSEFTINLISNASMETFPGNTLSCFTTLLPTPFTLSGEWQVALAEIAWPLVVQNVTIGEFSVAKKLPAPDRPEKIPERRPSRPGRISMIVPAAFGENRTPPKYTAPSTRFLKPGCYPTVDCILSAILKSATGKKPESNGQLFTWKVDPVTRKLSVKFNGNKDEEGLTIQLKSQDLRSILGTSTIIDCQQADDVDDGQSMPVKVVKQVGQWPVDLNAGSHTMLLYCDLVQNETLGDTQTALLRSIPLHATRMWANTTVGEVNHKSFTNLQWKRVVKSQFQSISLTLANEVGQKMPFLSCGRTNVTLAFRPIPKHF